MVPCQCTAMVPFLTFFVLPRWCRGWANITPSAVTKLMIPAERERERRRRNERREERESYVSIISNRLKTMPELRFAQSFKVSLAMLGSPFWSAISASILSLNSSLTLVSSGL